MSAVVEMRTVTQAKSVAQATGGTHFINSETNELSLRVDIDDFEVYRKVVEEISVLFKLYQNNDDGTLVSVPSGWTLTAAKFEVEWPDEEERRSLVASHFGARRYAYNWALAQVISDIEAHRKDPEHEGIPWNLASQRKEWNRVKGEVAPWWKVNSKECYSTGIADLVKGLSNWQSSKKGKRKGKLVSFPKFKAKYRDAKRVRFTTGTMRLEDDRRHITLPTIGALRSKESTRRVERHLARGTAHILSMTLSERWGRLFISVNYALRTPAPRLVAKPGSLCGVDLGLRTLATVADTENNIIKFENPTPLRATLTERRRVGRQMSRRIPGSHGHIQAKAKLAKLDRRAVYIRQEAWHQLTHWLASTYEEVKVEDLDIAAMKKSMGRRAFRRSVSDTALGMFRPMLDYKAERTPTNVTVVDRWFPSSQIHHGCSCTLTGKGRIDKILTCAVTGEQVDRDVNAAKNLRDWTESNTSCGSVGATAPVDPGPASAGTDPGSDVEVTQRLRSDNKSRPQGKASRGEARTDSGHKDRMRNPERGAA